jgi:20S proteasome alpha/beta subunit
MKCKEAEGKKPSLLFASDTQESSLYLKRSVTKMRLITGKEPKKYKDRWNVIIASAGDALVIDEVVDDIYYFLQKEIEPDEDTPSIELSIRRKEIGDLAYATFKKYKDREAETLNFELLLGTADEFSTILYVTSEGKTQELEKYGIIGSGRITGGELLINELLSGRKEDLSVDEAAGLAALIVTTVGHIDLSVGGAPDIMFCRGRISWSYKEQPFNEILRSSESKWDLMKKIWWKMEKDSTLERKLQKLVSNG